MRPVSYTHLVGTSVVKSEDFVVQIQTVDNHGEALPHPNAALRVQLQVRVEVSVAEGTLYSKLRTVLVLVSVDAGAVVREADAQRNPAAVVGRTEIPGVGSLALERGIVGAARNTISLRSRICLLYTSRCV